jgi:hypothetical protein
MMSTQHLTLALIAVVVAFVVIEINPVARFFLLAFITAVLAVIVVDIIPVAEPNDGCFDRYFSESYFHARTSFIASANAIGATLTKISVFVDPATGIDYTMDIAVVEGMRSDILLISSSGCHGPEGFAGSAIQLAALDKLQQGKEKPLFTTVFVHAVNPYGFANLRRFNENNVDLNRNNMNAKEWQIALARPLSFASYELFDPTLNLPRPPMWYDRWSVLFQAGLKIIQHGFGACKKALVTGQYAKPSGLYFGGQETQASLVKLHAFLKETFKAPKVVIALDIHSGLGPSGMDTLMVDSEELKSSLSDIFKSAYAIESPFSVGSDASAGYEDALGTDIFQNIWSEDTTNLISATQEFGTVPGILVVRAMIIENAGFHFSRGTDLHNAGKQLVKGVFYVPTKQWRASVVTRGLSALADATEYLNRFSASKPHS